MHRLRLPALLLAALLAACDQNPPTTSLPAAPEQEQRLPDSSGFSAHLGLTAYTRMSLAAQSAQELDSKLAALLYNPGEESLAAARHAWRTAYDAWLETLLYAYLPINDPPDWASKGIDYQQTIALLDSWPIEGGYIDYLPGYPFSGIVNDLTLPLNEDSLLAQHRFSDPTYASLGYHALEFMLWGADGERPPRDFLPQENTAPVVASSDEEGTAANPETDSGDADLPVSVNTVQNHNRRRQYVQLVSEQLQKHLHRLQRRWEPSNGYYAGLLQHARPEQVLNASLMAMQQLLSEELLGKRLSGNSSEFSNSSWADARAIVNGIRLLFVPDSSNEDPNGLATVLRNRDQALQQAWIQQLDLIDASLSDWQQQGDSEPVRQLCRQRLIELLSLLQRTADALGMQLPDTQ
ncbi:hypothetical protein GJQ55_12340 [Venatoribacter cucullus]|uniref:Imelysin-like domain-containing protein n=1 Tax=Venatoribacter cucullus TaxID=2661630 RepID=A0A9X7UZT8_9GAMM|nr:imelysin family protein [Venatoribacter cucullus]QQD25210.1 hypothetical protein GJQ55_12340 [Venatoribacter cucullus]